MSIFGEFQLPTDALALGQTLRRQPELVVEIDRVVAADEEYLTPYFAITGISPTTFEETVQSDDSISNLRHLTSGSGTASYRAQWQEDVDALAVAYTRVGASILKAKGSGNGWVVRMRFDSRENIGAFTRYLRDNDFSFQLLRLHEIRDPNTGSKFGLTPKQHEALVTAWEMGYFDLPRTASLADVASSLGITAQSLSDRLRRAQYALIGDSLRVTSQTEN